MLSYEINVSFCHLLLFSLTFVGRMRKVNRRVVRTRLVDDFECIRLEAKYPSFYAFWLCAVHI